MYNYNIHKKNHFFWVKPKYFPIPWFSVKRISLTFSNSGCVNYNTVAITGKVFSRKFLSLLIKNLINMFFMYCTFMFFFTSFERNSIFASFSFIWSITSLLFLSISTLRSYIFLDRASEISSFSFSSLYFSTSILLQIYFHFFSV